MAQVIIRYYGTITASGANAYAYKQSDNTSGTNGHYTTGDTVTLGANYQATASNGFYRVTSNPQGWVYASRITNITPYYETVTDPCTPPSSVTLNTSTKVLTVNGGAGGDLNTLVGWGISWRERQVGASTWGSWTADTLSAGRTVAVTVPAGKEREFRARTRGSAGANYFSAYVVCATLLVGNTAPGAPSVTRPTSGATTHSATPTVILSCPADTEGDAMTLKRQLDGGAWQSVAAVPGGGGTVKDRLPALGAGAHTLRYTLTDAHGLESGAAAVGLTVAPAVWSRAIAPGSLIASQSVSHQADIQELRAAVNAQRAYYGLPAMALPGTLGRFGAWRGQMQALQTAMGEALTVAGVAVPTWLTVPGWPAAAVVNQIRGAAGLA